VLSPDTTISVTFLPLLSLLMVDFVV